jgi:cytochrome c6
MHGEGTGGRAGKLRPRIRTAAAVAGAAAALSLAAGCGGDDPGTGATTPGDATTPGGEADVATTGGVSADSAAGRQLFIDTCGGCHQLGAADTSGGIGPNLDDVQPDAERVLEAIDAGPGAMPAELLEGEDAQQVADYVATSTGGA